MPKARTITWQAVRFGAIIQRLRKQRGWTVTKLARCANITPTYLSLLERGDNSPSLQLIIELTDVLGVDIGDVMREVAHRRPSAQTQPAAGEAPTPSGETPEA